MYNNIDHPIRELTAHRVNGLNEALRIFVLDAPGSGGACHDYVVMVPVPDSLAWDPSSKTETWALTKLDSFIPYKISIEGDAGCIADEDGKLTWYTVQRIRFQNGPVKEAGYNGNSHEALIAILLDRLESFQKGPFSGRENAKALDHIDEARLWLNKRTMDRVARGVEGTHTK